MTTTTTYENTPKKSYETPRLVIFGDVREITRGLPGTRGFDGEPITNRTS